MTFAYVYILASRRNGTLYVGVTNNIARRVWEHKQGMVKGFAQKHHVRELVYYEPYNDINEAIAREKCMKRWKRCWKINLIEKGNPQWLDLYENLNC